MKLHAPFIRLPLAFDATALERDIRSIEESAWRPHPQGLPGNSMLPLVAVDGDPANEGFSGPMRPTPQLLACPYLMQVMASLGATIGRSRLMRLSGQAEVALHIDQGYYWAERVRVHVPIATQPTVRFECGDAAVHMAAGECWIFDTWRLHRVVNDASRARIHLVVDTVGGDAFWDLVAAGRVHGRQAPRDWRPRHVPPQPGVQATFPLESVNVPVVMSPWEMSAHFGLLFADAVPCAQLQQLQPLAAQLVRGWRGLWAEYGGDESGKPHYRVLLDRFLAAAAPLADPMALRNGGSFAASLSMLVQRSALRDEGAGGDGEHGPADRA